VLRRDSFRWWVRERGTGREGVEGGGGGADR
jgi:hypothetical protein